MDETLMSPDSPAPKKRQKKVSIPPQAVDWVAAIAGDMGLGTQEVLRMAVFRGLAALSEDVASQKQRNIKTLVEHKLRLSLKNLGMSDEEIDTLVQGRMADYDDDA